MRETQTKVPAQPFRRKNVLSRLLVILLAASAIGWGLKQLGTRINESETPAGFGKGIVQGALMPLALPNLLVGYDVPIYAEKNTGRTYKLGYTVGVNGCGALFFGFFFWRVNRWRKRNDVAA